MTDINKAVELAREHMADRDAECNCDYPTCVLARAVLAMAPVVAAAREVIDAERYRPGDDHSMRLRQAIGRVAAAIADLDAEARRG